MRKIFNEEIFVENSTYTKVKERVLLDNLKEYKCEICNNLGIHNNKKLILQLDHINGKTEDNRLENLRFLCPNCHSQTDTYAGKSTKFKRTKPKPNYHQNKLIFDKKLLDSLKNDEFIKFGTWGWKGRLASKLNLSSQKVCPWLRRVDPDFLEICENKQIGI